MSESSNINDNRVELISIKIKTIDSNEFKIDIDKNLLISDLKKSIETVFSSFIFYW